MNTAQPMGQQTQSFDPVLTEDHRGTFRHFLNGMLFALTQVLQIIGLLSVGFAVGAGWWAGLALFVLIGVAVGLAFKRGPIFWAIEASEIVALIAGGLLALVFLR